MKRNFKNSMGITLIALVITIIILLILAGISIASLTGNGLFEKARLAKERTSEIQNEEKEKLNNIETEIDQWTTDYSHRGEIESALFGIPSTSGNGIETDPYIITNVDQLLALANLVNGGRNFEGKWFALGNDIILDYNKNWTPIGKTKEYCFKGNFNGNNHTIKGLHFDDTSADYVGLFGYADGSILKNINISSENSSINAKNYVGSIAGYLNNGILENCHNSTNVYGNDNIGGLIGSISNSTVSNSTNNGNISGSYIGGIIGYLTENTATHSEIINCENSGIISSGTHNGGICGRVYNPSGTVLIKGCSTTCLNIYGSVKTEGNLTVEN